ncbi:MAG: hypothetical protein K2N24_07690 [Lachnospiraceae bacterium]|nr:hypothetical protein [Lachnospiraceae bacterium]
MMVFRKEFNKVICSISYLIFIGVLVIALSSQGVINYREDKLEQPQTGQNYGVKSEEIPELIMPAALESLYQEFSMNSYVTYPIGFYKKVRLNDSKQEEVAQILSDLTGIDRDSILHAANESVEEGQEGAFIIGDFADMTDNGDGSFSVSRQEEEPEENPEEWDLLPKTDLTYEEFQNAMARVDTILGGGSQYAADSLRHFAKVPVTYEEAVREYGLVKEYDRFTGGYARLFCDYAGAMVCSVFPVFLAVVLSMKDKRARMAELVYTSARSSGSIVIVRYLAILCAVMLPVIILSYISNVSVWKLYPGMELDYLAPLKYDLLWLLPSVMIASAVGMCLTELTDIPIAIAVQGFWWFLDVNAGYKTVESAYSLLRLAPRHNAGTLSRFRTQDYMDHVPDLIANRLLMAGLAVLLIIITILIYERKRRGKQYGSHSIKDFITGFSHRSHESAA